MPWPAELAIAGHCCRGLRDRCDQAIFSGLNIRAGNPASRWSGWGIRRHLSSSRQLSICWIRSLVLGPKFKTNIFSRGVGSLFARCERWPATQLTTSGPKLLGMPHYHFDLVPCRPSAALAHIDAFNAQLERVFYWIAGFLVA